ncbi:hypothetical protein EV383_2810 [Pseudonocardia sediminis]|uniref:Histidine kinase/DNA gyrase B/HSP90-like ATPase n=1 Tax=Pseudonocardia sediminis TaxID=1397368 RepID=A0A4Q7V039_PSEST|nr:ATP-binding protein [Pseudonocardia sediminis]RZT85923.1 hypothetical protein EV383_2810 [Pseudonocardia sediminis]
MQRDDPSGTRPGGPAPAGSRGEGAAPGTDGDAVMAALAHRLRARSERQQLLTERLRSGELRPGALADLAELAAAARRGVRDGDHILVMSGTPPTPRSTGAVPLGQALSTAVAASEAASRTVVPPTPSVSLDGAAEPVFGQILAELLAHAVTTTGPGERLELHIRWAPDGGVVLELLCAQPAQNRAPIEDLDRMLAAGRPDGAVAPNEIGLYVAARLARAIGARLGTRSSAGTQSVPGLSPVAVLHLPPSLLAGGRGGGQDSVRTEDVVAPGPEDLAPVAETPSEPPAPSVPSAEPPVPPWPPIPAGTGAGSTSAQLPTGQLPTGQVPTSRLPTGPAPAGQLPTGQVPTEQVPTAQAPNGHAPLVPGDPAVGQVPPGEGPSRIPVRPMPLGAWRRHPNAPQSGPSPDGPAGPPRSPQGPPVPGQPLSGQALSGQSGPRPPSLPVPPLPTRSPQGPGARPPFQQQPVAETPPVTEALPVPGTTPPVELFGPFDTDVPVAVDDMDGTPIFAAVASAWFRDPEGAAGSARTTALPTAGTNGARGPENWSTVGDAEFEAARIRANRVVESPTTAQGLPQRRPGQQMVPPSRRDAGASRHASSMERQPDRVRNRLASYQRGLREGRHRAAEEQQGTNGAAANGNGSAPWPTAQPMAPVPGHGRPEAHGFPGDNGTNGAAPFGEDGRNVG